MTSFYVSYCLRSTIFSIIGKMLIKIEHAKARYNNASMTINRISMIRQERNLSLVINVKLSIMARLEDHEIIKYLRVILPSQRVSRDVLNRHSFSRSEWIRDAEAKWIFTRRCISTIASRWWFAQVHNVLLWNFTFQQTREWNQRRRHKLREMKKNSFLDVSSIIALVEC